MENKEEAREKKTTSSTHKTYTYIFIDVKPFAASIYARTDAALLYIYVFVACLRSILMLSHNAIVRWLGACLVWIWSITTRTSTFADDNVAGVCY